MFEKMLEIAEKKLDSLNESAVGLPASQVTVILTDCDNIYVAVNDFDGSVCEELRHDNNTKVVKLLTLWKNGGLDIPSFDFRQALIRLDDDNVNADIILQGKDGCLIKKLAVTMP